MKSILISVAKMAVAIVLLSACGQDAHNHEEEGHQHGEENHEDHAAHGEEGESVHLTAAQFAALEMEVGTPERKNLSAVVEANGQLEVPPQNEATVTAIVGANVSSIKVIEGDDVKKGQVLAYLSHPNLTKIQSDYLEAWNRQQFLEQDYQRQKKLYEEKVGSGKAFQQTQADYRATQAMVKSYESQLRQLGINPDRIRDGSFYDQVPLISPISGTITQVEVKTGQYVQPETDLFEIVNIDHIHADLMVFEKDVHKVEEGQRIRFSVQTMEGQDLYAKIYSVGKKFEQNPKAVHVHAEIENKSEKLIPGMYIRGQILLDSTQSLALPEAAITREGNEYLAFVAQKENDEWMFTPVRVVPGTSNDGWVGVQFLDDVESGAQFALNNAYYLIAEMKKGEAEHSH